MASYRRGEHGPIPLRSGRYFHIDARWYFACREGADHGPFSSRSEAESALQNYLRQYNKPQAVREGLS
jgi:hypothetical protein